MAWWVALQCDNEMVLDTAKDGVDILGEAQCVPTASIHHPVQTIPIDLACCCAVVAEWFTSTQQVVWDDGLKLEGVYPYMPGVYIMRHLVWCLLLTVVVHCCTHIGTLRTTLAVKKRYMRWS